MLGRLCNDRAAEQLGVTRQRREPNGAVHPRDGYLSGTLCRFAYRTAGHDSSKKRVKRCRHAPCKPRDPMTALHMPRSASLAIGLLTIFNVAACDDECKWGEAYCLGTVRYACLPEGDFDSPGHFKIDRVCEHCVEIGDRATCSLSPEPDPSCAGEVASYCDGTTQVDCSQGYPFSRYDCAGNALECAEIDATRGECALSAVPDPRCPEALTASTHVCDGNVLVSCEGGVAVEEHACPDACAQPVSPTAQAFCALSAQPSPECADDPDRDRQRCDINRVLACRAGFDVLRQLCSDGGGECLPGDGRAFCSFL
jgi:hypothetical protein